MSYGRKYGHRGYQDGRYKDKSYRQDFSRFNDDFKSNREEKSYRDDERSYTENGSFDRGSNGRDTRYSKPEPVPSMPSSMSSTHSKTTPKGQNLIKGTDPKTGENPNDSKFTKLLHHIDFHRDLKFSRPVDTTKNYMVTYEPDTSANNNGKSMSKKIHFFGESSSASTDPRRTNVSQYFQKPNKRSKKFPFKQLPQPKFVFDKDSLGPAPQTELVLWDLPISASEVYLTNFLKSYGDPIKDMKFFNDPINAVPLGVATFKFQGNPEKAMRLAKKLIQSVKSDNPKIDGVELKIGLNDHENELLDRKVKVAQDKLLAFRTKREEEDRKKSLELAEQRKRELAEQKKRDEAKKEELKKAEESRPSSNSKYPPNTTTLSIRHNNKVVSGVFLPKDLNKYIKDRPYILIQDKYVSTKRISAQDMKRALNKYDWTRVLSDRTGFYIVFNSITECEKCFLSEDGKKFYEYKMFMELAVPEGWETPKSSTLEDTEFDSKKNDAVEEATNMLIKEFQLFLAKDIRERVIAPVVLDLLSHDKYPKLVEEFRAKEALTKAANVSAVSTSTQLKQNAMSLLAKQRQQQQDQLKQSLPSFKRKPEAIRTKPKPNLKKNMIPMQHALNYDHDSDEDDDEEGSRSVTPVATKRDRTSSDLKPAKKQKTDLQKSFLYESSSDEEMEEEEVEAEAEAEAEPQTEVALEDTKEDEMEIDYSLYEAKYQPTEEVSTVFAETPFLPTDVLDLDRFQDLIKDKEDLMYATQVLEEAEVKPSSISNIDYWAWKQMDLKSASEEIAEDVDLIEVLGSHLESRSGAFKSEGYKKIPDAAKIEYLPHRRKIHKPLKTIQHEGDDDDDTPAASGQANSSSGNSANNNNSVQSSRVNRANNRRFAADITAQIGTETEVLSLNTLTKRKKPVSFARSAIHNWGLYALEPIAAKEMIIEYVGESIRQQVAEHREKSYLKTGIGSSYLFRIDENTVVDATKKGGIARFINHCCNPSCTAKIIKVEGSKRIVIYALRDIDANEELTYDYKFERETNDAERIRCLCGAPGCKGYLN